jgi:hypothetical protein
METNAPTIFDYIVWTGAGLTLLGMIGLFWCIVKVARAKQANLSDEDLRDAVKRVVPMNLGALFVSAIGLMMVIVGISLG